MAVIFNAWTREQASALRNAGEARRLPEIDWELLAEEIESLGDNHELAIESAIRRVVEHLLKLQFSPAADPRRGWEESVEEHRQRVPTILRNSPSLRPRLPEILLYAWPPARRSAVRALKRDKVDSEIIPNDSPYPLDKILDEDWWPANRHGPE